jgi:hypothetical protein
MWRTLAWLMLATLDVEGSWVRAPACGVHSGSHRAVIAMAAAFPAQAELKDEIVELLDEVENRGIGAPEELASDLFEVIAELEECAPPLADQSWERSPLFPGRWRLRYTSSKTFANNQGLSGYARDIAGVVTPELFMTIESTFQRLVYEEPLELEQGTLAGLFGRFANADSVQVEAVWSRRGDALAAETQTIVVGSNSWDPPDRQVKATRALSGGQPIYLDEDLLIIRSQPAYIVWVFDRP